LIQGLASTDVDSFDSNILKGIQVKALWFIMSVSLVKATSGVGDAAMISSQGAVQGRTQGGGLGLKPPLELDILQKLYYLRKEIKCFRILFAC